MRGRRANPLLFAYIPLELSYSNQATRNRHRTTKSVAKRDIARWTSRYIGWKYSLLPRDDSLPVADRHALL